MLLVDRFRRLVGPISCEETSCCAIAGGDRRAQVRRPPMLVAAVGAIPHHRRDQHVRRRHPPVQVGVGFAHAVATLKLVASGNSVLLPPLA